MVKGEILSEHSCGRRAIGGQAQGQYVMFLYVAHTLVLRHSADIPRVDIGIKVPHRRATIAPTWVSTHQPLEALHFRHVPCRDTAVRALRQRSVVGPLVECRHQLRFGVEHVARHITSLPLRAADA